MFLDPAIEALAPPMREWRRDLHGAPELMYDVHQTAAFVARKLAEFGCDEVATGIGRTGVVGRVRGRGEGRCVALRCDMDALPIAEETGAPHASRRPGLMHACGHDGHMAMMLGAAQALCASRDFCGQVVLVFQPAEEGGAGARAMIEDGLLERFGIEAVFGLHNLPGLPVGRFAIRPGPIMAATDGFAIHLTGRGGHAALPHLARDPILAGAALVQALQQVVSRNLDPLEALVLSVTQFHAGNTDNVIPDTATVSGTVRSLSAAAQHMAQTRIGEIADAIAAAHQMSAAVHYERVYPVTVNAPEAAALCERVAAGVAGEGCVDAAAPPLMAAEDFAFMLEARPGALIFLGNGDSAPLHNARYDFDDDASVFCASYWVALARAATRA